MNSAEAMRSFRGLVQEGTRRLEAVGIEHARHEVEWLLSRLLGSSALELYLGERDVPARTAERFFSQLDARTSGMPLQYLVGEAEFCGIPIRVQPGVFIPRPETEAVVEAALKALREREREVGRPLRLLDAGTGSGCIAVALARALPTCVVVGLEVSWNALFTARQNVLRQSLLSRVWLVQGRWLEAVTGGFDGIVANPPYVPSAQVECLPLEVREEPRVSLDGGLDGMRELRHLIAQASSILRPGGLLVLESGEAQVDDLLRAAANTPWVGQAAPIRDLAGRPRGVLLRRAIENVQGSGLGAGGYCPEPRTQSPEQRWFC